MRLSILRSKFRKHQSGAVDINRESKKKKKERRATELSSQITVTSTAFGNFLFPNRVIFPDCPYSETYQSCVPCTLGPRFACVETFPVHLETRVRSGALDNATCALNRHAKAEEPRCAQLPSFETAQQTTPPNSSMKTSRRF